MVEETVKFGDKTYKFLWIQGGDAPKESVSQVSGYVFNKDKQLLIVKNKNWTIPGGHPEEGEIYIDTLKREIAEEAMVEIDNIKYLGCVQVTDIETDKINYQLRYIATASSINDFNGKFETSERVFINPDNLTEYIPWASGKVFSSEVQAAVGILQ